MRGSIEVMQPLTIFKQLVMFVILRKILRKGSFNDISKGMWIHVILIAYCFLQGLETVFCFMNYSKRISKFCLIQHPLLVKLTIAEYQLNEHD